MDLTFLGTGAALPIPGRMQTGILCSADDRSLLVDCGSGVLNRLSETDVGYTGVGTVLLTHHHLDHVADLLPLLKARWLAGEEQLEIVGPTGTKQLVDGLLDVHDYLQGRCDLRIREVVAGEQFAAAGIGIDSHETRHSMDGLAYRFAADPDSRPAFAYTSDTEAFDGMARFVDGCQVVAHDCSFPDSVEVSGHPKPSEIGETFADSTVSHLVLTHLYPPTEGRHEELCESVAAGGFTGDVSVAHDGLSLRVG